MILKGSQRAGAKQLALHLLKTDENEHVELHELRGFVAEDLRGALHEAYAISRGTRCKQFLFSLSLSPPENAFVPVNVFEKTIEAIEEKLNLKGQPRAIVFHEKEGRRHAHAVWSRIDAQEMKAVPLPYFKSKLRNYAREIYLEQGWKMPPGFMNSKARDPGNYSLVEYQQARRAKVHPNMLKALVRECWAVSDTRKAFAQALAERGLTLARGDSRGFVAVDYRGEVLSVARYAGVTAKEVGAQFGDPKDLPSVAEAKALIAQRMTETLQRYIAETDTALARRASATQARRAAMTERHRSERQEMREFQENRARQERQHQLGRLNKGLRGLWDRFTGQRARTIQVNEREALEAHRRDVEERDQMIERQLAERQALQADVRDLRRDHVQESLRLRRDVAAYLAMQAGPTRRDATLQERSPTVERTQDFGPDICP